MMDRGGDGLGHGWPDFAEEERGPTIWANRPPPPDCPVPVRLTVPLAEAERRALRAFWRGVVVGGLLVGLTFIAGSAWGLTIDGTEVVLEPSADPAVFAEVVIRNDPSNGPFDTGDYTLIKDGLVVGVRFVWDATSIGADQIVVTPPKGMTCVPADCTATVPEGQTGRVVLFNHRGS